MSKIFFQELGIPRPDYDLGIGSASHAYQTGRAMMKMVDLFLQERPDLVMVVGDVNSTLAAALVAKKLQLAVAHIEAGLRSFDEQMPEEINRVLTDRLSDYLFCTEPSAVKNLLKEGLAKEKIFLVGNVMIDTLLFSIRKARSLKFFEKADLPRKKYAVLTLHRPKNVDHRQTLAGILAALAEIQKKIKIICPLHPRTKKRIRQFGFGPVVAKMENLILSKPLGYLEMLNLMANARFVLTDSGGIQEETTALGVPCLTLRNNTERPITIKQGTNRLVGNQKTAIVKAAFKILNSKKAKTLRRPKYWDGKTSERIIKILIKHL
jgi:UDP-N-acetylglucosamine 2-epimerase (non-hydrolysing)